MWQGYGHSPVWIIKCRRRPLGHGNPLPHNLHKYIPLVEYIVADPDWLCCWGYVVDPTFDSSLVFCTSSIALQCTVGNPPSDFEIVTPAQLFSNDVRNGEHSLCCFFLLGLLSFCKTLECPSSPVPVKVPKDPSGWTAYFEDTCNHYGNNLFPVVSTDLQVTSVQNAIHQFTILLLLGGYSDTHEGRNIVNKLQQSFYTLFVCIHASNITCTNSKK